MEHLLELNEFSLDIDNIIKRILSTGYISKSMSNNLDLKSGIVSFVDKLVEKIDYINDFFKRNDREYYDDLLLEFFDMSNYNYVVNIGICIKDNLANVKYLIFDDRYEKSDDKQNFLLIELLDLMNKMDKINKGKYDKDFEDIRNSDRWIRNPRGRYITKTNIFKNINSIKPIIKVDINHKDLVMYVNNQYDPGYVMGMRGLEL